MVFVIIVSVIGCVYLFLLAIFAFAGMEALKIHHDDHIAAGFQLLLSSLVRIYYLII